MQIVSNNGLIPRRIHKPLKRVIFADKQMEHGKRMLQN